LTYLAPEAARSAVRSFATDSFAIGSSLFALLVGATPNTVVVGAGRGARLEFDERWHERYADTWGTTMRRVMPIGTPKALRELVMDLIHPDPQRRLQGADSASREMLRRRVQEASLACRRAGLVGPYALDTSTLAPSPGWTRFRSFFADVGYATDEGAAPEATQPL
jgi:serine/threonine protein kinase